MAITINGEKIMRFQRLLLLLNVSAISILFYDNLIFGQKIEVYISYIIILIYLYYLCLRKNNFNLEYYDVIILILAIIINVLGLIYYYEHISVLVVSNLEIIIPLLLINILYLISLLINRLLRTIKRDKTI